MKKYVVGFMFDQRMTSVVLIRKLKPAWQVGMLNGVGGKVNPGEADRVAMVREFREEAGVHFEDWKKFATISDGKEFKVTFYAAADYEAYRDVQSVEAETIVKSNIRGRGDIGFSIDASSVFNINWLIPLALDEKIVGPVEFKHLPNGPSAGTGTFGNKPELKEPTLEPQFYKEEKKMAPDNGGSDETLP